MPRIRPKTIDETYRLQWISWLITVVLIAAAAYFGIELPALPAPPGAAPLRSADVGDLPGTGIEVYLVSDPGDVIEALDDQVVSLLAIVNEGPSTITLVDGGRYHLAGDQDLHLEPDATLLLYNTGDYWIELARSLN